MTVARPILVRLRLSRVSQDPIRRDDVRRRPTVNALAGAGIALACAFSVMAQTATPAKWTLQTSGVDARFRGVSAVSERVAWASGARGTIVRTTDGGATW